MFVTCPRCTTHVHADERVASAAGGVACPKCQQFVALATSTPIPMTNGIPPASASNPAIPNVASFLTTWRVPLIAAGGACALLMMSVMGIAAVTIGATWFGSARTTASGTTLNQESEVQLKRLQAELEAKSRDIRDEVKAFEKQRVRLTEESDELQRKRDKLAADLKDLTARMDSLQKFMRADFVLINPSSFAVGVRRLAEDQFEVVNKAEGQLQQDAIRWARKEGLDPIDKDPELTRRLYDAVTPGELIPASLVSEVRPYWQPHRFVPIPSEQLNPPFLVFQKAEGGRRQLGFFLGTDGDRLKFRGINLADDTISRERIQVGSARVAAGDKILAGLDDADFLDYSVLSAAHKLGSPQGKPRTIRVAVRVSVDALNEELKLSKQMDTRGTDQFFEFCARLHGKPYPRDARKEPVRVLRETAMYIEDELYQKLTKLGVPVLERQKVDELRKEHNLGKSKAAAASDDLLQKGATHVLFVDVQAPQSGGRYHLAFRLSDARRKEVLWAETGERLTPQPSVHQRFLLQTGKLAVVKLKKEALDGFHGLEPTPVAMPVQISEHVSLEQLVILEDSSDSDVLRYRALFDPVVHELPRQDAENIVWVKNDRDVPVPHQVRYAVWTLASKMLPAAGRVTRVEGDRATITLGRRHGLKSQDILQVRRQLASPNAGGEAEVALATTLSVTEVHEDFSRVVIGDSGLTAWQTAPPLLPSDLVVTHLDKPVSVAILPPIWKEPTGATFNKVLGMDNPIAYQKVFRETGLKSDEVADSLASGLRAVGVAAFDKFIIDEQGIQRRLGRKANAFQLMVAYLIARLQAALDTEANHVLVGDIQPIGTTRCHLELSVYPLDAKNVGLITDPKAALPQLGQQLMSIELDINCKSLK